MSTNRQAGEVGDDELPAWLETPPGSISPPPVVPRPQVLPLEGLAWEDFERLCVRLVRREADIEHCQLYGTRGQKQHGIDILGRLKGVPSYALYQCKQVEDFGPSSIKKAVKGFLDGKWSKQANRFVLCFIDSEVTTQHAERFGRTSRSSGEAGYSIRKVEPGENFRASQKLS